MAKKKEKDPVLNDIVEAPARGRTGVIGKEEVNRFREILKDYQQGKKNLELRVTENEKWYRQRHWEIAGVGTTDAEAERNSYDPKPISAWLLNSLANKHADAMDNFPAPNILPQEASDMKEAQRLSSIIPVVLENNDFEDAYSANWWAKLKHGTAIYGVLWDGSLQNGLGDISVKPVDVLNVYWEPGIKDIQQGRYFFHLRPTDNDLLISRYPFLKGKLGNVAMSDRSDYSYDDTIDRKNQTDVVDCYYKKMDGGKTILHYCKFVGEEIIYASENDTEPKGIKTLLDEMTGIEVSIPNPSMAQTGWYEHGKYPFVFDVMFPIEGSPCGFGYVDIMKEPQIYIDKMNQIILKNALMSGRKRFFVKKASSIKVEDFADWSKDFVEVEGAIGEENIREFQVSPLPAFIVQYMQMKIDELKETSGNRDFSQGGTSAGVTAASAIAALQEAGSKLSRDMIKGTYQAFKRVNYLCIDLAREFYTESRSFRITDPNGQMDFVDYDNQGLRPQITVDPATGEEVERLPIFDIKVIPQRQSPFSRIAQNEMAKELYGMGLFDPARAEMALIALDMMDFEGKDKVMDAVRKNQQMFAMIQQLQQALGMVAGQADMAMGGSGFSDMVVANGLVPQEHPLVAQAREQAANLTNPTRGE